MKCTRYSWIWIVLVNVVSYSLAIETPLEWDTGRSQSVFASILKTLSSSNVSPNCPGRCFNALAAMVCTKVVDKPGMCPQGYRCCQNLPSKDDVSTESELTTIELENATDTIVTMDDKDTSPPTSRLQTTTVPPDTRDDQKNIDNPLRLNEEQVIEKVDTDTTLLQYSPKPSMRVCRGVCVVKRISSFCEAAIDIEGLCKTDLRCCVPANLFDGFDEVPKEFVILNPAFGNNTKSQPNKANALPNLSSTTPPSLVTPQRTTNQVSRITTLPPKTSGGTTGSPREQGIRPPELNSGTASVEDDNSSIPPERRCKGTCVAGFFAFLCDSIDRSGECPHERRCCVTDKRPKAKPRPRPQGDKGSQRRTTPPPQRITTTSTTTQPSSTTSREPPPPPCLGTCLPVTVASRCQAPSRLVVASGCRDDEICCDDMGKRPNGKTPLQSKPENQVPQALGTLLSLFGGGSQKKRPSRPARPNTTPSTTTTTTPATTTMAVPECPGTCIAPILSFTCFGNAEISDLFECNKEKQTCCAPKSAIRKQNIRNQMNNIARNDTIYPHQFQTPGHYTQAQYEPQLYHKQNYIPAHYHQQLEGGHFHRPIYNRQPHLQPPPPPSPPHLRDSEQHQLPPVRPLQPPPQFEAPPFEKPVHEEKQILPPYHQPAPDPSDRPPLQPTNHYSSNNNPQFYQPGPTYEQNHTTNYPHPSTTTSPSLRVTTPEDLEENIPIKNKYVCGVKGTNRAGRVVGGEDSLPGEWCWQVALINSLNQYLCGGALIGTQWVLTAAHCVTNIVRSGDAIYVRVGDHDLTTRYGSPGAQTIPVATTYIHHNHNSQTLDNDIALLKLSTHAELGQGVCLVCLPARGVSQVAGKRCTVTGYGYMGETGPIPLRIRKAEIPVVSDNECVRQINAVTEKIFILPASSFCAGGESGHDACQGDGGGPLVCNVDNYFELSGLVSWGFGCGRKDVPGVYVKVSSFIGWINQIISVNNS